MQCHGEKGMFYLGALTGVIRSKSRTDVTSNITGGHYTVLHAWTLKTRGDMPQRKLYGNMQRCIYILSIVIKLQGLYMKFE